MHGIFIVARRCHHQKHEQTLYQILGVKKNCTPKEIRDSFFKLSKKNHPDMKVTGNTPAETIQYIKIIEAYKVLNKKSSRDKYDLDLQSSEGMSRKINNMYEFKNQYVRCDDLANRSPNQSNSPYYGIKGVSKVSNLKIATILLIFATLGTLVQMLTIRNSFTLRRELLDDFSKEAGLKHANVRADAEKYGNEKQLERLAEKWLQKK